MCNFRKLTLEEAQEKYGIFWKLVTTWVCPVCGEEWSNRDAAEYEWCCPVDGKFTPLVFGYVAHYDDVEWDEE
jgi:hypothetical protein